MKMTRSALVGLALVWCCADHVSSRAASVPTDEPRTAVSRRTATATVASHIQDSFNHYQAGDFARSIQSANQALAIDPTSAVAYNNLCSAHSRSGAHDEAILACRKALELEPGYYRAQANLEWAYERAVEQDPVVNAYIELSVVRHWMGKLDESIEACNRALELDPDNAISYNNICAAHARKKEWDLAVPACERALSIDPDLERAKNNLEWARSGSKATAPP